MVAITRNRSFSRQQRQRQRQRQPGIRLRWAIQTGICIAVGLFYFIARDASVVDELFNEQSTFQRSLRLTSRDTMEMLSMLDVSPETAPPETPVPFPVPATVPVSAAISREVLECHLRSINITDAGKALVRSYDPKVEDQPLRHLRFDNLIVQEVPKGTPIMETAYSQSTVITQAPWFPHHKICNETCCAQAVAISLKQDRTRIINAVDGPDLADALLYGNSIPKHHKFAGSELREEIIPCLQPGVIIHADSYRGPITRWFHEHRPKVKVPYVFITSKTDGETPIKFFTNKMDTDPLMLAWYGINPNYLTGANHSKFRMMPLGLTGNKFRQAPDLDLLMQARNYSNPFAGDKSRWTNVTSWMNAKDTTPFLFVKFGLHVNALHRDVPFNMACQNRTMEPLDNISCNLKSAPNPRQTYAAASKYLFGLSPPGNGLDCFRTYEYLLNGLIPIVEYQPEYEELFEDLPVIQLKHWNYTQKQLVAVMRNYIFSAKFLNNTFDAGWDRLFLQHWRHKVLKDAGRLDEIITDPEGNQYYKGWQYSLYKEPYIQHATEENLRKIKEREENKRLEEIKGLMAKNVAQKPEEPRRLQKEKRKVVTARVERNRGHEQIWNDIGRVKREINEARQFASVTRRKAK